MANGLQPIQDPFGLSRLSQSIRQNRAEKQQRGLQAQQQQLLGLQIQQQQQGLAQMAQQEQLKSDFATSFQQKPSEMSDTQFGVQFFQSRGRPELAQQFIERADKRIKSLAGINPERAADLFNKELASIFGMEPIEHYGKSNFGETFKIKNVETGDEKLVRLNETTGEMEDIPIGQGFQFIDSKGQKTAFDQASKIRGEITKASDSFNKITDSFGRIKASSADPSAAGDLALIFNFMKMLDPGSVVRESEFATAANSAGVPDRIRNQYNRVLSGERLAVNQRADFINQANNIFQEAESRNAETVGSFVSLAERFGLEEKDVVVRRGQPGGKQSQKQEKIAVTATNSDTGEKIVFKDGKWGTQ